MIVNAIGLGIQIFLGLVGGFTLLAAMLHLANPKLSWPIAASCVTVLVLSGLAAGVRPARRAACVDPVEALRFESTTRR